MWKLCKTDWKTDNFELQKLVGLTTSSKQHVAGFNFLYYMKSGL